MFVLLRERAREVFQADREFTKFTPAEIATGVVLLNLPPLRHLPLFLRGKLAVSIRVSYVGDPGTGRH